MKEDTTTLNIIKRIKNEPILLLWVVAVIIIISMIAIPVLYLAQKSLFTSEGFSFSIIVRTFMGSLTVRAVINTLIYVTGITIISLVVGVPLALFVERLEISSVGRKLINLSMISSIITPPFLFTMAYIALLGPNAGLLNIFIRNVFHLGITRGPINVFSLFWVLLLGSPRPIALIYYMTSASLNKMNPELEETAKLFGANNMKVITTITLPIVKNAILASGLVALTGAMAAYGSPHMLGFNVLTLRIRQAMLVQDFPQAAAISLVLVLFSLVLLRFNRKMISKGSYETVTGKSYRSKKLDVGRFKILFSGLAYLYGIVGAILPLGGILVISSLKELGLGITAGNFTFNNYYTILFRDSLWQNAFKNSTILSIGAATIGVILSVVIAYLIIRGGGKMSRLLDYISVIPLGIAGTALAVALIVISLNPPFRQFGLYGTLTIIMIAYIIRQYPVAIRPIQSAWMQINSDIEESARSLGATWLYTVRTITFPLIAPGILAGWILVFLQSFTELSSSILLRHIGTNTVSTAILDVWDGGGGFQRACAMGVMAYVVILILLLIGKLVSGEHFKIGMR